MKLIIVFVIILNVSAIKGLKCFECKYKDGVDESANVNCMEAESSVSTVECSGKCFSEIVKRESGERGCKGDSSEKSGCKTDGNKETCYCDKNKCNNSVGNGLVTTTAPKPRPSTTAEPDEDLEKLNKEAVGSSTTNLPGLLLSFTAPFGALAVFWN